MGISLIKATVLDIRLLYEIQMASFKSLLEKYGDYDTNPGAEKIERTINRLNEKNSDYYLIKRNDVNIGAIRVVRFDDLCMLKQIYILPEYQGNGYAQQAILQAESFYPEARHWELDTIKQETKLCYLYEKMGYKRTGKEEDIQDGLTLVFYGK